MATVDLVVMRPSILPLVGLAVLAAACFEAETTVTLRADGSGIQSLRLCLGELAVGALKRAVDVAEASATRVDPLEVFDADKVRAELQPTGIVLDSHRVFTQRGRRCVELQAAFASLAALRGNPLTGGARATWEFSAADHPGQVRLVYYPQGVEAWRAARAKARELAQEPDAVVQHFVASRLREIDGLDVTLNLELPGDVVAHTANLALTGKRSVQVKIRAADIKTATDLLVRLAPRFEVIFTGPDFPLPAAAPAAEAGAPRTQAPDERNR